MFTVLLMAEAVPGPASSGLVLPLLIFADIMAAAIFRQEILWKPILRIAGPMMAGVVIGWAVFPLIRADQFRPLIGWMVLGMLTLHLWRQRVLKDGVSRLPDSLLFAWGMGLLTGVSTMIANAAGPIATIYLLVLALPKKEYIATMAWLFLFMNLFKVPFAMNLGLISADSIRMNLPLLPAVVIGLACGRWLVNRIPQGPFQAVAMSLAAVSALRLVLS